MTKSRGIYRKIGRLICSVEGCSKISDAKGFCPSHYMRFRLHGTPLGGGTANGEPLEFFRSALAYDGDECLAWPFAKTPAGYGQVYYGGKLHVVSRLICSIAHGEAPSPDHDAAHSCGKGHLACVAKNHLSWKTKAQNQADRVAHGTDNRGSRHNLVRLTPEQVIAIRELRGKLSQREIAIAFNISQGHVCDLQTGKRWGHI